MKYIKKYQGGWILKWAIIIVGIILVLSYFGFDLEKLINSDTTQGNFSYIGKFFNNLWVGYGKPFYDAIANLIAPYVQAVLDLLQRMGRGGTIGYQNI